MSFRNTLIIGEELKLIVFKVFKKNIRTIADLCAMKNKQKNVCLLFKIFLTPDIFENK